MEVGDSGSGVEETRKLAARDKKWAETAKPGRTRSRLLCTKLGVLPPIIVVFTLSTKFTKSVHCFVERFISDLEQDDEQEKRKTRWLGGADVDIPT
jgi:hypothetical protein